MASENSHIGFTAPRTAKKNFSMYSKYFSETMPNSLYKASKRESGIGNDNL